MDEEVREFLTGLSEATVKTMSDLFLLHLALVRFLEQAGVIDRGAFEQFQDAFVETKQREITRICSRCS